MAIAATFRTELKQTVVLAGPVVAGLLGQNAMGFIDTVMVGRLGSEPLAAVALGNTIFFFILLVCMGVVMAVTPMVSQAFGAGQRDPIARSVRQGFWLSVLLTIPAVAIVWNIAPLLRQTGQGEAVVLQAEGYLRAVAWGFLPMLWFTALRCFVEGLSKPWPVTIITLFGCGLNIVADYVLMFGKLGFPAMGVVGTGWATTVVLWFLFVALTAYIQLNPTLTSYGVFSRLGKPDRQYLRELFRLGWPIGVSHGLESGLFTATALILGVLGTVALAAHQIAIQSAAFTFMVPLGIGIATSVRVGQAVGRGDAHGARRAGYAGMALAVLFMTCSAIVFWTMPEMVVALYLDVEDPANAAVVRLAVGLLGVAAVFQIFDGAQVSAAGALRGLKDTRIPMVIGFISYWMIGLSTGYILGIELRVGPAGLWWGLVLGLASAAVLLSWRFWRLTVSTVRLANPSRRAEAWPVFPVEAP